MEEVAVFPRKLIPTALGLWIGFSTGTGRGQDGPASPTAGVPEPGRLALVPDMPQTGPVATQNQRMADAIAERLQRSGQLRGYRVDIRFTDGLAELSGLVADGAQRTEVLRIVQSLPGVEKIRDSLEVKTAGMVLTAQGPNMERGVPSEILAAQDAPPAGGDGPFAPVKGSRRPPFDEGMSQEPMSIMQGINPGNPPQTAQQPPMPPYAWPTVAPYNNYSRVAYPTLLRHEAFPFIGPMHPFPKVPLGWRSVSLTWQDGFWWYGKKATGHDWWRIRYY